MSARRGQAGFTLVEMLVSLALFAIIASVATMLTFTATRAAAATGTRLATVSAANAAAGLLAADLAQAAARPVLADDGTLVPAFVTTESGIVLTRRGLRVAPGLARVAWGIAPAGLVRQTWPSLDGARPGPATLLLPGVSGARFRVLTERGWTDAWVPATPDALPRAVEATLSFPARPPLVIRLPVAA